MDIDAEHGSFLAITTDKSCAQAARSFSPDYNPDSTEQIYRFIVIELRDTDRFKRLIKALKQRPCLDDLFHDETCVDVVDAKRYCRALLEDNLQEKKKAMKKNAKLFAPDFLAGRADEDVVLVYPFPGDKIAMEKAADGLVELSRFGLCNSPASTFPVDSEKEEESSGTRTHCLTISVKDCNRLAPETYLNDTLIDFFMKWMTRNDAPDTSPCHYFSTHFYSKLCKEGPEGVQKWTERKGIDVFQKRLIFVPVNKTMHWSLAVIVNPGEIDDHCDLVERCVFPLDKTVSAAVDDRPCPVILFFDSLKCHPRKTVAKNLRKWLNAEWKRKMGGRKDARENPFTKDTMKVLTPGAPAQENAYDCGVFTCRNAFAITMLKDRKFSYTELQSADDFFEEVFVYDHDDIERIRNDMLLLIERLSKMYQAWDTEQKRRKQAAKAAKQKSGLDGDKSDEDGNIEDGAFAPKSPPKFTQDSESMFTSRSPSQIEVWEASPGNEQNDGSIKMLPNENPQKRPVPDSDKVLIESGASCGDDGTSEPKSLSCDEGPVLDGVMNSLRRKHGKPTSHILGLKRVPRAKQKGGQSRAILTGPRLDSLQCLQGIESPNKNGDESEPKDGNVNSNGFKTQPIDIDSRVSPSQESNPPNMKVSPSRRCVDKFQPNPTDCGAESNASFLRSIECHPPVSTAAGLDEPKRLSDRIETFDMNDAKGSSAENAVEIREDENGKDRPASPEVLQDDEKPGPSTPSSRSDSSKVLEVEFPKWKRVTSSGNEHTVDSANRNTPKHCRGTVVRKQQHGAFEVSSLRKATDAVAKGDTTAGASPRWDSTADHGDDDDDDDVQILGTSGVARTISENQRANDETMLDTCTAQC
eukprot:scaffold1511_cov170-Amphora_coffeaeformis.AAC.3